VKTEVGGTPKERRQARTRPASLALRALLLTCFSACVESSGPPVSFRLGQTIPLGEWNLRVRQPEVVSPKLIAGFHELGRSNATSKVIAVHLVLEPKDSALAESPKAMEKAVVKLMAGCGLKDGKGTRYPIGFPVPDSQFRLMKSGGVMSDSEMKDYFFSGPDSSIPKDWVVLYSVPQDRSGFTFLIRNFFPLEGQPQIASVDLGR
jgi:hypothetical protein